MKGQGSYLLYSERMRVYMLVCLCVPGLLCYEAMGHIGRGGFSMDKCSLIFPLPINFDGSLLCVNSEKRQIVCRRFLGNKG